MENLALAAITFAAMHLLVAGTRLRDRLVAKLGEKAYRGAFSLASIAALWWLIAAWAAVRVPQVTPLLGVRGVAVALMLLAFALVVLGLTTFGPTAVGSERLLDREDNVRGIHRVTRHPFLWGVALWALVHAIYNPQAANLLFFGTFIVVAAAGTFSLDAKRARAYGEPWQRYAGLTSNIPFAAIAQKRNTLVLSEIGWLKPAIVVAVFAAFVLLHGRFFGLPAL